MPAAHVADVRSEVLRSLDLQLGHRWCWRAPARSQRVVFWASRRRLELTCSCYSHACDQHAAAGSVWLCETPASRGDLTAHGEWQKQATVRNSDVMQQSANLVLQLVVLQPLEEASKSTRISVFTALYGRRLPAQRLAPGSSLQCRSFCSGGQAAQQAALAACSWRVFFW